MSKAAVESAEMILGSQNRVNTLSVTMDSTIESMYEEIVTVTSVYPDEEWIILTDIIGGTPFNASYRFLETNGNLLIVTGFNLPLLIELFMHSELRLLEAAEVIKNILPNTMSIVDKTITSEPIEEDSFDL
jgi:PTS system fructose subfamily IIA component